MRRFSLFATALAVALVTATAVSASGGIPGASGTLWVTERSGGSVTAYDAASGAVHWTTNVGAAPIGVVQPHGTQKVYSSDEGSNQMSVLDRETGALLKTIAMGPRPHHLSASQTGEFVYVAEFGSNTIGVIDTSSDARVAGFAASANPAARTHMAWITRNGEALYATNSIANTISKLHPDTGALLWEFPIGNNPSEIITTPEGKTGYVSIRNENRIAVVDLSGELPIIVGSAEANVQPDTLSLTPDRKTLVVGLRGTPARMALIDTETLATTYVALTGTTTGHQWLSADGMFTCIAVESPGGVAVVDNEAAVQIDFYPYPGGPRPHGVFYAPDVLP
jgi:DNA-binding beta-propeller fold protein YncE